MRVCKRRYHTELLRLNLAARMVEHEARTETIRRWSGVSEQRVRDLYRSFRANSEMHTVRHRGPAPRKPGIFLKTPQLRTEAVALAALCYALGLLAPRTTSVTRRELEAIHQGELLCRIYEIYRRLVGASELTLDHTALLVTALSQGTELRMGHCTYCGDAILFDPCADRHGAWRDCCGGGQSKRPTSASSIVSAQAERPIQQNLF